MNPPLKTAPPVKDWMTEVLSKKEGEIRNMSPECLRKHIETLLGLYPMGMSAKDILNDCGFDEQEALELLKKAGL